VQGHVSVGLLSSEAPPDALALVEDQLPVHPDLHRAPVGRYREHFRIIAGIASAGLDAGGSGAERVVEFDPGAVSGVFKLVNRILPAKRAARARLREGDLLMSIFRQSSGAASNLPDSESVGLPVASFKADTRENWKVCIKGSTERVKPEWANCVAGQDVIALRAISETIPLDVLLEFLEPLGFGWFCHGSEWLAQMTRACSDREAVLALKDLSIPIFDQRQLNLPVVLPQPKTLLCDNRRYSCRGGARGGAAPPRPSA
jgi:hypothetical protein